MKTKEDLVKYRLKMSEESFATASMALENRLFNASTSSLYYTCFYLVTALFARDDIEASTHSGVRTIFGQRYVKTGKVEKKWADLFSRLFNDRQKSTYSDFNDMESEEVATLYTEVEAFRIVLLELISKHNEN